MTNETIAIKLDEIRAQLGKPYPETISSPIEITSNDNLSNFLRSGPQRKIFLLNCAGGDYEYDENMNADVEIELEIANDNIYNTAGNIAATHFGLPLSGLSEDLSGIIVTDYDDDTKEGEISYGIDWTPEYEGGAVFENADTTSIQYWNVDGEYIALQKGKWSGDGNFILFTVATITPKIIL